MNKKGFTLFEILIVLGITSLFMSIFLINFSGETKRIKEKQEKNMMVQVENAIDTAIYTLNYKNNINYDDLSEYQIRIVDLIGAEYLSEKAISKGYLEIYPCVRFDYNEKNEIVYIYGKCDSNLEYINGF